MSNNFDEIAKRREKWEQQTLQPALKRFGLEKSPSRFYTPLDVQDADFLSRVGFPGEYPFTAGAYPVNPYRPAAIRGIQVAPGLTRAAIYSGYGTPEDTRDYYKQMQERGQRSGPNLAFDLPTQCGYDSDNPLVRGEVGKAGVAVNTLADLAIIYEAFQGDLDLDKIASNFTINAPANIILAMYIALAQRRGIPPEKLRATPQNDILKEYVARGTYIFPPRPSVKRLFRDSLVFLTRYCPNVNVSSIGGYHIRAAGATREQDLAFSMAIGMEYLRTGIEAGLSIDHFAPRFTFNAFGGSLEFFKEIGFQRAARRMWARILKEKFGAKDPRSMLLRDPRGAHMGHENCTVQRPLNNAIRAVVGAMASAMSGGSPRVSPPFDEALGLGWSLEAIQLAEDSSRILQYEANLTEVLDPFAGSYYVESLTDRIEEAARAELDKVEAMGGAIAAIESGYMQRQVGQSAYERQKRIESGEDPVVGVNCFVDDSQIEVTVNRTVPHPYDEKRREAAEAKQVRNLTEVKRNRDNREVGRLLEELRQQAKKDSDNLIPHLVDCAQANVTLQEMCDVFRQVFGEYRSEVY